MHRPPTKEDNDREPIERVYQDRKSKVPADWYTYFNPGNLFMIQQRERAILKILDCSGMCSLSDKVILDIGCGTGGELRNFVRYGASPHLLHGIDVLGDRIALAKKISPNITFQEGSARSLPFADGSVDIVTQFTVFTSILDRELKKSVAQEMVRVVKENGIILWYDFQYSNPRNQHVQGIKRDEILRLFPGCSITFTRVTLAPPLVRRIAPVSWLACYLLDLLPFLRTHYLAVIRKTTRYDEAKRP